MAKRAVPKKTTKKKRKTAIKKTGKAVRKKQQSNGKSGTVQKNCRAANTKKVDDESVKEIRPLTPEFLNALPVDTAIGLSGKFVPQSQIPKVNRRKNLSSIVISKRKEKSPKKRRNVTSGKQRKKAKRELKGKSQSLLDEEIGPSSPQDFEKYKIIPDIIDKTDLSVLDCYFKVSERNIIFENYQYVKAEDTIAPPKVVWASKSGTSYTIVMLNVDSPKPEDPSFRSWIHWGVCNVRCPSSINEGNVFCEYVACCPAKGCGIHRFCIVLLEQLQAVITVVEDVIVVAKSQASGRPRWNLRNFAEKYGLKPVAARLFRSQWDTSCPSTYRKMGF